MNNFSTLENIIGILIAIVIFEVASLDYRVLQKNPDWQKENEISDKNKICI